jgi:GLPGLI family protein
MNNKNRIQIVVVLIIFTFKLLAQSSQSGCINYQYTINTFGINITQTAQLIFDNGQSVFIHSKGDKGFFEQSTKKLAEGDNVRTIIGSWYQDTVGIVFFKDFKTNKLVRREFFEITPYVTEEPKLPKMNWTITSEQKKIGKFQCQKASTRFRGRNYVAWFTMTIPVSDGPWLLNGLPGLILEAIDDKKEVKFIFSSANIPNNSTLTIQPPTDGVKVDFQTYKKAGDVEFEKIQRQMMSNTEMRGVTISFSRDKTNEIEKEFEQ